MFFSKLTTISAAASLLLLGVSAAPAALQERASCTYTSYAAIPSDVSGCSSVTLQGPFTVPANSVISLSLATGATLTFKDTITFAKGTLTSSSFLVTVTGTNINIDGTSGKLDGSGQSYYDGQGANGGIPKPKFFKLNNVSGKLTGLTILNSPVHTFSINNANGFTIDGVTIDDRGANYALGHNTDAFDVSSSTTLIIQNSHVYNNDDCLAVNSGKDIHFVNNYCYGGHGVSIGSIKTGKVVDGVYVSGTQIVNSMNGVRIKVYNDCTGGSVSNVKYDSVTLSGITDYGIVIEQDYTNSGATGTPGTGCPISGVTLSNIHGTMASGDGTAEYILCAACSGFNFSNIAITGAAKANSCTGVTGGNPCS